MSDTSAPASPMEVQTPPPHPVAAAAAASPAPALPAALPLPAPPPAVPTAAAVEIAREYGCFPFADGMLTLTDGFRPHSRPQPPRRLALRAWSPYPAVRPHPPHCPALEPRGLS
jgi:hypothetical protein